MMMMMMSLSDKLFGFEEILVPRLISTYLRLAATAWFGERASERASMCRVCSMYLWCTFRRLVPVAQKPRLVCFVLFCFVALSPQPNPASNHVTLFCLRFQPCFWLCSFCSFFFFLLLLLFRWKFWGFFFLNM